MNDKKQIEEMAKILNECCNEYDEQGNHLGNKCPSCAYWSDTNHVCVSYNTKEAEALYNAGYRKQSDLTPCDVCRFNPPSSADGKPCSVCPAQAKGGAE